MSNVEEYLHLREVNTELQAENALLRSELLSSLKMPDLTTSRLKRLRADSTPSFSPIITCAKSSP